MYSRLFVFVEGDDDARLFREVFNPLLERTYDAVDLIQHRRLTNRKIEGFLASIESMKSPGLLAEYIYLEDLDSAANIETKKAQIRERLPTIREENIVVVAREIEAWYLAGLDRGGCERLGVRHLSFTDDVTKEQFNGLIPSRFRSRIDFMAEIVKLYSIPTARDRNTSFRYFADKFNLQTPGASA